MKRILTLLLAGVMLLALAACGTKNPDPTTEDGKDDGKTLRVAMECGYAPYNWMQSTDANGAVPISGTNQFAYGYDVKMAQKIATELDMKLEIVQLKWEAIIPAVLAGTVDVAICGQSTTPDRKEMVDFTDPYYYASIVVVVPQDGKYANATSVAELDGAKVTSQLNTIWNDVCVPQIPNKTALTGQDGAPAMLAALQAGRVDIIVTDRPTGMAAVAADPKLKMIEFEGDKNFKVSEDDINIGISTKKGNTELIQKINGVLATMNEDDYNKMMEEAIQVQPLEQ